MEDDRSSEVIPFAVAGRQTTLLVDFLSTRGLHNDAYLVAAGAGDRDGESGSDDDGDCSERLHEMHLAPPKSNENTKDKRNRYVCDWCKISYCWTMDEEGKRGRTEKKKKKSELELEFEEEFEDFDTCYFLLFSVCCQNNF